MADIALSDPDAGSTSSPEPCRTFGFWATTAFGVTSIIAWMAAQALAAVAVFAWLGVGLNASDVEIDVITSHAMTISIVTIASMPAAVAVLVLAVRRARCSVAEYLALGRPSRRDLLVGLAAIAILLPLGDLTSYLSGHDIVPTSVVEAYRTARASGHLLTLGIALVLAAPLMEELLFRGFLFRGYAASRLGIVGTILVTSAAWAVMHIQYEPFYIGQIFLLGCAFGWLRWRSGTTTLTLILHGLVNLAALVQVAYLVERSV